MKRTAILYLLACTACIFNLYYGARAHDIFKIAAFGLLLNFLGMMFIAVTIMFFGGGKSHDNPDKR